MFEWFATNTFVPAKFSHFLSGVRIIGYFNIKIVPKGLISPGQHYIPPLQSG
jgi:hypothetical protein